jgi:hypothetical protein
MFILLNNSYSQLIKPFMTYTSYTTIVHYLCSDFLNVPLNDAVKLLDCIVCYKQMNEALVK